MHPIRSFMLVCIASSAQAQTPSSLVVFGDSLSDTGNFSDLLGGIFPPPPYAEGRLSNGPLWVERLADRFGVLISANNAFALDSSVAMADTRLSDHLANVPVADPDALHVIFIGGNDFLEDTAFAASGPAAQSALADQIAGNITATVTSLAATGASRFLLMNLPDIGLTPEADFDAADLADPGLPGRLSDASAFVNAQLDAEADLLRDTLGIDLFEFDVTAFFDEIRADPAAFGFTDVDNNVLQPDLTLIGNPDEYVFWDNVHPTARAHQLLGDAVYDAIVPAPGTAVLLLSFVATRRRR